MRGIKVNRALLVLITVSYVLLFNLSYIVVISPIYSYYNFSYTRPPYPYLLFSWLMAILPSVWMPIAIKRPSQVLYWFLYVFVLVPASTIPFYILKMDPNQVFLLVFALEMCFAGLGLIYYLPLIRFPRLNLTTSQFWSVMGVICLGFYGYFLSVFGVQLKMVSFLDVYTLRMQYRNVVAHFGSMVDYTVNWLGNILNPLLIIQGLVGKRYTLLVIGFLGQFMIYSIAGFKDVLLSIGLILAVLFALSGKGKYFGLIIVSGMAGVALLSILTGVLLHKTYWSFLLIGRPIAELGVLTALYYDYFSTHAHLALGHSIFKFVGDYPYSYDPAFLIGRIYFSNPQNRANVNFWGDAFANFGFQGIIVFTLLLALLLWVYDSFAKDRDPYITILILAMPAFVLTNAALLTAILTHGFFLVFVIVYLLPKSENSLDAPSPLSTWLPWRIRW